MTTFPVDDVTPVVDQLPVRPLAELFPDALTVSGPPVIEPDGVHPLLSAVARAFAEHRPLVLSPDAVWLTIAQGFAQHLWMHAEELRPRLVDHDGRRRVTVEQLGPMPVDSSSWQDIVEQFGKQVAGAGLFECDFTTSTEVERTAGQIVMLDAYSPYFAFWVICVCGIPSITLTGTVEDWRKIRERVDAIAEFGLGTWCRSLVPIADQFVRAAEGDVDTAFWQRIHNAVDAYGGERITGWAARFYPYLETQGTVSTPNPLLELPIGEPRDVTGDDIVGIRSDTVPASLSRVLINVNAGTDIRAVALHAGLVGVTQHDDGALCPVAGWHLSPAKVEIEDVIDRIVRDHGTTPPEAPQVRDMCADMTAVYHRIGSASLFDGAWRLRPRDGATGLLARRRVPHPPGHRPGGRQRDLCPRELPHTDLPLDHLPHRAGTRRQPPSGRQSTGHPGVWHVPRPSAGRRAGLRRGHRSPGDREAHRVRAMMRECVYACTSVNPILR